MKRLSNHFNSWIAVIAVLTFLFLSGCGRSATGPPPSRGAAVPALDVREIESPAGADSREPELFTASDGRVILSWVEKGGEKRYALRFAARGDAGWSEAHTAAEGENWFINWADFPSVIALPDGSLAAHWLVKSGPGTYAYDVNLARSKDGATWGRAVVPHTITRRPSTASSRCFRSQTAALALCGSTAATSKT